MRHGASLTEDPTELVLALCCSPILLPAFFPSQGSELQPILKVLSPWALPLLLTVVSPSKSFGISKLFLMSASQRTKLTHQISKTVLEEQMIASHTPMGKSLS
jgi:hypothetical protein